MGMSEYIEPLAADLWFQQIEKIADGGFRSIENALRHVAHLLQLAPEAFRPVIRLPVEEDRFEALLEAGDLDTAARVLIAEPASLSVRLIADGKSFRATITCFDRAFCGTGTTKAAAVVGALTAGLLALKPVCEVDFVSCSHRSEHTGPSEPGRLLS